MNFIFFTLLVVPLLGWDVVVSSLNKLNFMSQGWKLNDGITPFSDYTCPVNSMTLLCHDGDNLTGQKLITGLPPHYEVKVVADLYFVESNNDGYGILQIDAELIFSNNINIQAENYNNLCGYENCEHYFEIKTVVATIPHAASDISIQMSTGTNNSPNERFCFRNVQLLINKCHYSCLTCDGNAIDNCLSCYGVTTPVSGRCPICSDPNFSFQTSIYGCTNECPRANYLADQNKFCQLNTRVSIQSTSIDWDVSQVYPITDLDWNLYNNGVLLVQRIFFCGNYQLTGMYWKSEIISKSLSFSSITKSIRIRISHYMFNVWNQFSYIELLMDGVLVSFIYIKDGIFRTINTNVINNNHGQCSNLASDNIFIYFRTEQIIKITNLNPIFTFRSNQDLWSVRNIYIDSIDCSLNCSTCLDDQNCSGCQASYYLYKGQCISTCPEYSIISGDDCIDFDEETQYTSYLIKAFYSFDSYQDIEITLFNLLSSTGTNFQKGESIYFSYLNDRRIFGGALVWLNAKFGNTYSIPQPHYAVRVRMVVILGDDFGDGQFHYQFESDPVINLTEVSTSTSHGQKWGTAYDEYLYQINTLVSHTASSFSITVECIGDTSKAINQAFCGISNYFVTVLECQTFCDACTDISTCSSWSTTTANFDPITHQCFPGYSTDISSKACVADPVCGNGILELNEECDDGNSIQADGCFNCQYQCSSYYTSCVNLYQNSCEFGYQLNQFDNICYPKCGDGIIVAEEQCEDGNIVPFDGCHLCMFSCQDLCSHCSNGECLKCKENWFLQNGRCYSICRDEIQSGVEICNDSNLQQCSMNCQLCSENICQQCEYGYYLNDYDQSCQSFCGDSIVSGNEQCDQGLDNSDCIQCRSQCHQIVFQNQCLICIDSNCLQCNNEIGWYLNAQGFCETICGDGIVVPTIEQCEDNNVIQYDGCFECQLDCQDVCTQCVGNICYECDTPGWYLIERRCYPKCGDMIIVSGEYCDDGNNEMYDGCFECQFQCEEKCNQCISGVCFGCVLGWAVNDLNICETVCGDLIVVATFEDCDDGNQDPFDGCDQCSFQKCEDLCTLCIEGICYECDNVGWQINEVNHKCEPICNDGLVTGTEQCDDMNLIPYDGCFECKFQCDQQCLQCEDGVCLECNFGYSLNLGQCQSQCGDGQLIELEECDDGNQTNMDGCSQECKIEENWICKTQDQEISTCFYSTSSEVYLSLLETNSTAIQKVSLKFNIKLQLITKWIQPKFSFNILDLEDTQYQILLSPIVPLTTKAQLVEYTLQISFNISVFRPVLIVNISNITNEYQQTLNTIEGRIYLLDSQVISLGEQKATQTAQSFSQIVLYVMAGIAALSIMTGSLEMFWNLLDMLQLLSYIKYVNITFPYNIDTYFEVFKLITISPFLQFLGVDAETMLQLLNGDITPYVETKNKFKDDQINAYFLSNFYSGLLCFILAYFNYYFSLMMSNLVYKIEPWAMGRLNFTLLKQIHKIGIFFRKSAKGFYYSAFIRIFLANYYDLMFAACIQMNNLNWDNVNMAINSGLSILAMIGQVYIIFGIASKIQSFTARTTICKKNMYDSIFEGVKENNANFWTMQLNSVLLLKKFMFMVIIVNCQGNGAIQTIYLSISSAFYLAYIIITKPFYSKSEFMKQIICESVISFGSLTFLIYEFQYSLKLNYSQMMMMGWIHIGLFSGILCSTMFIDLFNQINLIYNNLKGKANAKLQISLEPQKEQQKEQIMQQKTKQKEVTVYGRCIIQLQEQ